MTLARKDTRKRSQERFLKCHEETVQVLKASRWAKVARSAHYRWLEEDPTYLSRFQAACIKADQRLMDDAVRRARNGEGPTLALLQWLRVQNEICESLHRQDTVRHFGTHLRARERESLGPSPHPIRGRQAADVHDPIETEQSPALPSAAFARHNET